MSDEPINVQRSDGEIVSWPNVPVAIQKKILSGTMTEEDWVSDWDELNAVEVYKDPKAERTVEDVVSNMLNSSPSPVAKHVHVFRKEYRTCMLKGCDVKK